MWHRVVWWSKGVHQGEVRSGDVSPSSLLSYFSVSLLPCSPASLLPYRLVSLLPCFPASLGGVVWVEGVCGVVLCGGVKGCTRVR